VLDSGANSLVEAVVFLLPDRQGAPLFALMWDEQAGPLVAAVGDRRGGTDSGLGSGLFPAVGVVPIPGQGPADYDNQASVGVDDDLVSCRVAIVLGLLGDRAVAGWHRGAGDDEHSVPAEPPSLSERQRWTGWSMNRSAAGLEIPNDGAGCRIVKFVRQYAVTSRTRPSSGRLQGRPRC